mgnify:CR=1 FL=1
MITWPIFLALILAFFAVRSVIKSEEQAEYECEKEPETKSTKDNNHS